MAKLIFEYELENKANELAGLLESISEDASEDFVMKGSKTAVKALKRLQTEIDKWGF